MQPDLDRSEVTRKVLDFVGEVVEPDMHHAIRLDSDLILELGLDSVDMVTFTVFLEDEFPGRVDAEHMETEQLIALRTPGHWVEYVLAGEPPQDATPLRGLIDCDQLPFGRGFTFVDKVERFSAASRSLEASRFYSPDDPAIRDHRIGGRVLVPGIYLAEQINQTALLLGLNMGAFGRSDFVPLRSLLCRFERPVSAGCTALATVEATSVAKGSFSYQGTVMVDRQVVAYVEGEAGARQPEADP